jgi:hypothetical protein
LPAPKRAATPPTVIKSPTQRGRSLMVTTCGN